MVTPTSWGPGAGILGPGSGRPSAGVGYRAAMTSDLDDPDEPGTGSHHQRLTGLVAAMAVTVLVGALALLGCSSDSDDGPSADEAGTATSTDVDGDGTPTTVDDPAGEDTTTGASVEAVQAVEAVQLGFGVERFEVPRPDRSSDHVVLLDGRDPSDDPSGDALGVDRADLDAFDALAFDDGRDLLDTGLEVGAWTEVEGLRAILSVLLGELPTDAIDGFDELRRASHGRLLDDL